MNRTQQHKLGYFVFYVSLFALIILSSTSAHSKLLLSTIFLVLFLIYSLRFVFFKNYSKASRFYKANDFPEAATYFEAFIVDLEKRPWLNWLYAYYWNTNTLSAISENWTYASACYFMCDDQINAFKSIVEALKADPQNPMAHYQLAMTELRFGDQDRGNKQIEQARELGYSKKALDNLSLSQSNP